MLRGLQIMQYFLLTLHMIHVHSIIDTWKQQLMNQAVTT